MLKEVVYGALVVLGVAAVLIGWSCCIVSGQAGRRQ